MTANADMKTSADKDRVIAFTIEALTVGGAEQMLVAMANEFSKLGWQVHMICLSMSGELASGLDEAVHLHVLNKHTGVDIGLLFRLRGCLRQINPQCVNSHLWVANLWTRVALLGNRIPVVVTEHSRDAWKPWHYKELDRLLAHCCAAVVCVSGDTASFYRDTIGIDEKLITVINNGVDTQRYANGSGEPLRGAWLHEVGGENALPEEHQVLIGTVGRMVSAKNHPRLIDALALLINDESLQDYLIKLVMVGDGPERGVVEAHVNDKQLTAHVVFTGSRHDIPDVLSAFDIFTLSSDREGHPLTALEAQAAGTPVVLTDAGGSVDAIAIDGGEAGGVLVERSAEALAAALKSMIVDPALRSQRARFGQQYALAHFDKRHMVERYASMFDAVKR